jgi:hypothetical protein
MREACASPTNIFPTSPTTGPNGCWQREHDMDKWRCRQAVREDVGGAQPLLCAGCECSARRRDRLALPPIANRNEAISVLVTALWRPEAHDPRPAPRSMAREGEPSIALGPARALHEAEEHDECINKNQRWPDQDGDERNRSWGYIREHCCLSATEPVKDPADAEDAIDRKHAREADRASCRLAARSLVRRGRRPSGVERCSDGCAKTGDQ